MIAALRRIKAMVPPEVAAAVTNCGGTNYRRQRFAGNLLRKDLSDADYLGIFHALIFPNGVRKSTAPGRNAVIFERLLGEGVLEGRDGMRVLDIAASLGVDSKVTCELLSRHCRVGRYLLGDLYTQVFLDEERGLVFDEDGRLIQVRRPLSFVSIHFAWNYWFQRFVYLPKRVRPWLIARSSAARRREGLTAIPLIHPSLDVVSEESPFRLKRLNVFEPLGEQFDLIICMHLLVPRYFDAATLARGVDNLAAHLTVGGSLVVGAAERFEVVTRRSERDFERRSFTSPGH